MDGDRENRQVISKKRRTALACSRCKQQKLKCSGVKPSCAACSKIGLKCEYRDPRTRQLKFIRSHPPGHNDPPEPSEQGQKPVASCGATQEAPVLEQKAITGANAIRVPFFRWFGPTGIAPGYKKMLFDVSRPRQAGSEAMTNRNMQPGTPIPNIPPVAPSTTWFENDGITPVSSVLYPLLATFFHHYGCHFPFYTQQGFIDSVKNKQISALVLNSVCGLAARFSDLRELHNLPPYQRGEPFAEKAKVLLVPLLNLPSYDVVAAILMIVWLELAGNRDVGVWMYMGMACRMAMDLGMHKNAISSSERFSAKDYWVVSHVWHSVYHLDHIISFATGRPLSIERRYIDVPPPSIDRGVDYPSPFPCMVVIMQTLGLLHDELNGVVDQASILGEQTRQRLVGYSDELIHYYVNLPPALSFNINNFQAYVSKGEGGTFLMLHLWFNAIMIGLHRPGLRYGQQVNASDVLLTMDSRSVALSSARTISSILSLAEVVNHDSLLSSPFIDQAVEVAGLAFIAELASSQDPLKRITNRSNYDVCLRTLQNLIIYFKGVGWVTTTMQQKEKGMQETDPAEGSVDPQSLIELQDIKMMQKLFEKAERAMSNGQLDKVQKSIGVGFSGLTSQTGQGSIMFLHPTDAAQHGPESKPPETSNNGMTPATDPINDPNFISEAAFIDCEAWDTWLDPSFWADLDVPFDSSISQS